MVMSGQSHSVTPKANLSTAQVSTSGEKVGTDQNLALDTSSGVGTNTSVSVIKVGDIRHLSAIAKIQNDALVEFDFGREAKVEAGPITFNGRVVQSRGNIPGFNHKMPPIYFLALNDFSQLRAMLGEAQPFQDDLVPRTMLGVAWYCPNMGAIEVPAFGTATAPIPKRIVMTARAAKELLCSIIHESAHAAGCAEFFAHKAEYMAAYKIGLIAEHVRDDQIMKNIHKDYESSEIAQAQNEFDKYCDQEGKTEENRAYWAWVEQNS